MLVRAINLCGSPLPLSELDDNADATASYAGAYGYSYQTLKCIKDHIDDATTTGGDHIDESNDDHIECDVEVTGGGDKAISFSSNFLHQGLH